MYVNLLVLLFWVFLGPSEVRLSVDGSTDDCSRGEDIVFSFTGFSVTGQVRDREKEMYRICLIRSPGFYSLTGKKLCKNKKICQKQD